MESNFHKYWLLITGQNVNTVAYSSVGVWKRTTIFIDFSPWHISAPHKMFSVVSKNLLQ